MDDTEYYAKMRKQYSPSWSLPKKSKEKDKLKSDKSENSIQTPGNFSKWNVKYGHEDAEMFQEKNSSDDDV